MWAARASGCTVLWDLGKIHDFYCDLDMLTVQKWWHVNVSGAVKYGIWVWLTKRLKHVSNVLNHPRSMLATFNHAKHARNVLNCATNMLKHASNVLIHGSKC